MRYLLLSLGREIQRNKRYIYPVPAAEAQC